MNKEHAHVLVDGTVYDDSHDGYDELRNEMNARFNSFVDAGNKLFKTNVDGLWEAFLSNLPVEARQFYNCNSCRHFFNRFGGLVTISEDGVKESVIFDLDITPKFFKDAVKAMNYLVLGSKVNGVFLSEEATLGYPKTGEYTHFYAKQPNSIIYRNSLKSAGQTMAEKREDFKMLTNALNLYSLTTVDKALELIDSEALYRSDRVKGIAQWFKKVMDDVDSQHFSDNKRNTIWLAVATAPNGFTHVRSSMIGTLLDDIQDGLSTTSIVNRFAEKMNPSSYMRSQSAPSENSIYEAEKTVEKLGIANSLGRRYAKIDEIPEFLWKHNPKSKSTSDKSGGVFGHLTPKAKEDEDFNLPTTVMTWAKFYRTVLPTAESVEARIDSNRFMALVTASDADAPNILQWDNTFSWYYHGGVDGEIKRRVEEAGGRYENNEIRASLIWDGYTDLDLHCITPSGREISFSNKVDHSSGGYLDVDANGGGANTKNPVENIRFANNAPAGRYKFFVHNFSERENGHAGTPFKVELEINGKTHHYSGKPLAHKRSITVFEFDYRGRGYQPTIAGNHSSNDSWGADNDEFVKVNGITSSPNLWGENQAVHAGAHIFFLLDGVKDESEGLGRGFFNEMLQSDLRPIRKTLELYTANTPIEGAEEATACGVGYSIDNEWNLVLKVKTGNSTRLIKIDRWD